MRLFKEVAFAAALTMASLYTIGTGSAHGVTIGSLEIEHPWSREAKHGIHMAAGFMSITNNGAEDDRLIKATAEVSDIVQLHNMKMENDVMSMFEMKDGIVIPAGQTVELRPMSLHVMFMEMKSRPKQGDKFKGTLTFEKAGTVAIEFEVEASDAAMQ
jgi:copper(I)-binding protein